MLAFVDEDVTDCERDTLCFGPWSIVRSYRICVHRRLDIKKVLAVGGVQREAPQEGTKDHKDPEEKLLEEMASIKERMMRRAKHNKKRLRKMKKLAKIKMVSGR